ncbi:MAG: GerAB/ArcD/ProY family transporter [Tumebacillaceae bacterium]
MKKYALNEITLMQYILTIHGAQVGVGVLTLPRELATAAGTDGWISLLIGWAVSVLASVILIQVMKKHPDDTVYDLLPRYFGKWIGKGASLVVASYYAFAFFNALMGSIALIKVELLPHTPNYLVVLLFLLAIYTIGRSHIRIIARKAEITFWMFIWLFIIFMYPMKDGIWLHLLPVLREGWLPVLTAVKTTGLSFLGFEVAFVLYPFLNRKEAAVKGIVISNTLTLLVYLIVVFTCFLVFSPDDITSFTWPTLKVIKLIEFRFLERFEILFLVFYLFMLSTVMLPYIYCAVLGTSQLLGKQDHRPHLRILMCGVLLYSIFVWPSYEQLHLSLQWLSVAGIAIAFALPVFLWGYTSVADRLRKGS